MKKYLFLAIFCCMNNLMIASPKINNFFKTTNSDPVKRIVKEIAKSNIYDYITTAGIAGTLSKQNILFDELLKTADNEDLIKLATKNKNAVVRLYAYRAIVQKFKEVPKDILDQFNNDTSPVNTMRGGITDKKPVNVIAASFLY